MLRPSVCGRAEFLIENVINDHSGVSALIFGVNEHPLEQLSFSVLLGQDSELGTSLFVQTSVGHVGLSDLLVEHSAFLLSLVAVTSCLLVLKLVELLELPVDADILLDSLVVVPRLYLVID